MEQSISLISLSDRVEIAPGVWMPRLGPGTYLAAPGPDVEGEVSYGLSIGYRGIDTAAVYHNEESIGRAIKASGVPRADLFVATKVWNSDQGYEQTLAACEQSVNRLGLDYVDLYLVHWPVRSKARATWRGLVMEILGHSQIAITANLYTHLLPEADREAAGAMQALLGRKKWGVGYTCKHWLHRWLQQADW